MVGDPAFLLPPDTPNLGSQSTQEAWWYFKQFYGGWWQNGWLQLKFSIDDTTPFASF